MTRSAWRGVLVFALGLALGAAGGFLAGSALRPSAVAPASVPKAPTREPTVNLVEVAVEVNRVLEPEASEAALRKALHELAAEARRQLAQATTDEAKVAALNRVLLADRKVSYLSNIRWRDTSLAAALLRKRGNCLATTTLYLALARELGLPIRAVPLPRHVLARFDGTPPRNIETTMEGAEVTDAELRARHSFGDDEARDFGYGRSLSDDEFASHLLLEGSNCLRAQRRIPEAMKLVERALALWPGSMAARLSRASLLYEIPARRGEALQLFQDVSVDPAAYSGEARAAALVMLAMHHHSTGDPKTALALLRGAFLLAPKDTMNAALAAMSTCYRTERDYSAAALAMELATLLHPEVEELTGLAIMYKNANRLDDAIRVLGAAVAKNPEDWNLRLILAGYLIRAGKTDEGWRLYATVKEPRDDKAHYHMNMAWFHAAVGKKKEFLDHLATVLELSTTGQILTYIATEADFDRYRSDPDFQALVERHRRRLLGSQSGPPPAPADPKARR